LLDTRIQAMETAYRRQLEALDVFDPRKESEAVRAECGSTSFANGRHYQKTIPESQRVAVEALDTEFRQEPDSHKGRKQIQETTLTT
jgi:hypothetical protein